MAEVVRHHRVALATPQFGGVERRQLEIGQALPDGVQVGRVVPVGGEVLGTGRVTIKF